MANGEGQIEDPPRVQRPDGRRQPQGLKCPEQFGTNLTYDQLEQLARRHHSVEKHRSVTNEEIAHTVEAYQVALH